MKELKKSDKNPFHHSTFRHAWTDAAKGYDTKYNPKEIESENYSRMVLSVGVDYEGKRHLRWLKKNKKYGSKVLWK